MADNLRVDGRAYEQHADDTRATLAGVRGAHEGADRQQQFLEQMTEDGIGSDEIAALRANNRHVTEDLDTSAVTLADKTLGHQQDFARDVRNAARNIKTV